VAGQRLVQAAGDILLGWERAEGFDGTERDFYVRQLRDWKAIPVAEEMVPAGMQAFGGLCGATLARAHARSGDRIAIASYLGKGEVFDAAISRFAEAYADQNERDHAALLAATRSGRVHVAASSGSS
jgi:sugar/nucleoside kinase (ribokinase family)